jgi:hypothetical protein
MTEIRKGYCPGCPYDFGAPATEMAFNLGCLPGVGEIKAHVGDGAWPCHASPHKVCCGFAADCPSQINGTLRPMDGVHSSN